MLNTVRHRYRICLIALSLTAAACGLLPGTGSGPTEEQPGPGSLVVEGDPPLAARPLVIEFVAADGIVIEGRTARIPSGGVIEASVINLPGPMSFRVNGAPCQGTIAVESDRRTDVILRIDDTGCRVETSKTEPL